MGGASREGSFPQDYPLQAPPINIISINPGGKAKPLKAPKKEKKDLDEEDLAFREKQKAGESHCIERSPGLKIEANCFGKMPKRTRRWPKRRKGRDH